MIWAVVITMDSHILIKKKQAHSQGLFWKVGQNSELKTQGFAEFKAWTLTIPANVKFQKHRQTLQATSIARVCFFHQRSKVILLPQTFQSCSFQVGRLLTNGEDFVWISSNTIGFLVSIFQNRWVFMDVYVFCCVFSWFSLMFSSILMHFVGP